MKLKIKSDLLLPYSNTSPLRCITIYSRAYPISVYPENNTGKVFYCFDNDSIITEKIITGSQYEISYIIRPEDLDDEITCYIAVLPSTGKDYIKVFSNISNNEGGTRFITDSFTPNDGLKAGHVYELSVENHGLTEIMDLQRNALIDFYNSTNGDNWINNTNWCSDRPIYEWYGLSRHWVNDVYISYMNLSNNNLSGQIPESFGDLYELKRIDLQNNELTGNIPKSMAKLPLMQLNLNGNRMSGTIPEELLSHPLWKNMRDHIAYQQSGYGFNIPFHRSTDYSQDRKLTVLQTHTKGKGIKIFILGECYTDKDVADGTYLDDAKKCMGYIFEKEPYTTFREYFDVYSINVVSSADWVFAEHSPGFLTPINSEKYNVYPGKVLETIKNYPETPDNDYTVVVLCNNIGVGWTFNYTNGVSVSFCGAHLLGAKIRISFNTLFIYDVSYHMNNHPIHRNVCGMGFGYLADEYTEEGELDPSMLNLFHERNWFMNVDNVNDPAKVCWSYFLTDPRYNNENIGIYEGALGYPISVYRATEKSIMRIYTGNNPYTSIDATTFNAPSRRSIYQRIMELSGETYSFEKFLEYDEINRKMFDTGVASRSVSSDPVDIHTITAPPVYYDYPSTEAGKHKK